MKNWQQKKIIESKDHQNLIFNLLNNQSFIRRHNKKITLDDNHEYIEFISCSYLGLDQHYNVIQKLSNNIEEIGLIFSSARTRMKFKGLDLLEDTLNNIFSAYTVIFSTTHLAHLGLIPLIASGEMPSIKIQPKGCTFLLDTTVHASIQINRGLMQQFGNVEVIDFYNLALVEEKLKNISHEQKTPLLFSDSVCSMGGILPLLELLELTNKYNGYLYLDDAHGMSLYGKKGAGYVLETFNNKLPERIILTTSLAKGFGASGGVAIFNDKNNIDFIKTYCSTYMFSGSLPNPLINSCIEIGKIHLSPEIYRLQKELFSNVALFDSLIENKSIILNYEKKSPIRGIYIQDEYKTIQLCLELRKNYILTTPATYPIRKKGEAIIRILISANHTIEEISKLCYTINSIIKI